MQKTKTQIKEQAISDFKKYINLTQYFFLKTVELDFVESNRKGVYMTDLVDDKKKLIDCFCSAGCFNVGRGNDEIRAALNRALDDYDMGDYMFVSREKAKLADKLAELAPGDLNHVMFTSGGGEANDCAIKLARGATGKPGIIAMIKAYHGHTGMALSCIGKPVYRAPFEPLMEDVKFVAMNDLEAVRAAIDDKTAAVFLEPVQGEAGIFPATQEFMTGLRRLCDERGILLMLDEVQTGFGRTGKMFCCEHYGVEPDIMTVAKSISGALYPISAVLFNARVNKFLQENPESIQSGSGGTDIGCAVAQQVIDFLVKNDVPGNAARMGDYIGGKLLDLQKKHKGLVREVRRKGLMIGLEYEHDMIGPMMSYFLVQNGVFAVYSGNNPKVMRFMPPPVINKEEADRLVAALDRAMSAALRACKLVLAASKVPILNKMITVQEMQVALFFAGKNLRKLIPFGLDKK